MGVLEFDMGMHAQMDETYSALAEMEKNRSSALDKLGRGVIRHTRITTQMKAFVYRRFG
jgi:hypothetical protein